MPERNDERNVDWTRRTFMKASGVAAGVGLLGAGPGSMGAVAHEAAIDSEFLQFVNPRVRRAVNAWERGYRGRADRALATTDTGIESRHPDLGPWNGVVNEVLGDGDVPDEEFGVWKYDSEEVPQTAPVTDDEGEPVSETFSGFLEPIGTDTYELDVPGGTGRLTLDLEIGPEVDVAGAANTRDEIAVDVDLHEGDRPEVAALRDETDRIATYDFVDPDETYELEVTVFASAAQYEVTVEYFEFTAYAPRRIDGVDPFEEAGIEGPDDLPQVVGWNNQWPRYHYSRAPRDRNSHGSHVAGIMSGSGRACTIDPDRSRVEEPRTLLLPGETLSYEVDAEAETGVFGAAYGQGIELVVEGPDGRQLSRSDGVSFTGEESLVNSTIEAPTVHVEDEATYTVVVRAQQGEALPARVQTAAVGAFHHHEDTTGDVVDDGDLGFHSGVAPGYSLLSITELGSGTDLLGFNAADFAREFNLRVVNKSWGLIAGYPGGTVLGIDPVFGYDETVEAQRETAKAGILMVAAAGNDATPATGNNPPAIINEAVSTVATGPLDGIAAYSDGGIGGVDDESGEPYTKPDVAAIGGVVNQLDQSAVPGDHAEDAPHEEDERFGEVRLYDGKAGTSMASPSAAGLAGLVAQAMEEDAPGDLELPAPAVLAAEDLDARPWTLRVKQTLLATASTTAFHAAPYHRAKAPRYQHDDRDQWEGYGRLNFGAAVDAVTRDLLAEDTSNEAVGLNVPGDQQAIAGYVHADEGEGEIDVSVEFSHYGGGNAGMARGDPHVDLYVYDALRPEGVVDGGEDDDQAFVIEGAATGDPNTVASDVGYDGEASVSAEMEEDDVYYVVAKLVNVPGVVNGYDVQAYFDLQVDAEFAAPLPSYGASGDRDVDSTVKFGRTVNMVELTVTDLDGDADRVVDRLPENDDWRFLERFSDGTEGEFDGDRVVDFGAVDADEVEGDDEVTFTYFVETPDSVQNTGTYGYGEATAVAADSDEFEAAHGNFAGTDSVVVVAVDI